MTERAHAGDWVEVHRIVLEPGQRPPQVPADTQAVPLELRVRGFATRDGRVGDAMSIRTASGRTLTGTLVAVRPAYSHGFGCPVPALQGIAAELRAMLEERA